MTAWPSNCAAAHAAEQVYWKCSAAARHALLIDTPAVPLRFDIDSAATPEIAAEPIVAPEPDRRRAQMSVVRDLRAR